MIYLISICAFLLVFIIIWQLLAWMTSRERRMKKRLKSTLGTPLVQGGSEETATYLSSENSTRKKAKNHRLKYLDDIQDKLSKAGVPLKPGEYLGIVVSAGLLGFILGMMLFHQIVLGLLFTSIGLLLPGVWVQQLYKRRIITIESQLLDAVVMMASSLRAGHSFMQAMELVSRETPPPLAAEFVRVVRENRVGMSIEQAMQNMLTRVESRELELLVSGVLIQRQIGGNLAEILDNIASTLEKRIKMRAKIRALTAQSRLSAIVIALMPLFMGVFVFGKDPKWLHLMLTESGGIMMLVIGTICWIAGIFVLRKMVDIDV